jgi:chromosome segregation ATPase
LLRKHKKDRDNFETELEEAKTARKRAEHELRDASAQKISLKKQLDEADQKVRKLIRELEDESKRHISEVNQVHEQYRNFQHSSKDMQQRVEQYRLDW